MSTYCSDPHLPASLALGGPKGVDVAACILGSDVRLIVEGGTARLEPHEALLVGLALCHAAVDVTVTRGGTV